MTVLVSWAALVVAIAAAGFTAWQAVTAHLQRTRPRPASWAMEIVKKGARTTWMLHNTGGSTATDVRLSVTARKSSVAAPSRRTVRGGVCSPGEAIPFPPIGVADPRRLMIDIGAAPYESQTYADHNETDAYFPVDEFAEVSWRDRKDKRRKARVRLR